MPRFSFEAINSDGQAVTGSVDAPDEMQALKLVSGRGLTPVDLSSGATRSAWWNRELTFSGASSVKPNDLENFFESFAALLRANLSLPRALAFCQSQTSNFELSQTISELRSDIENGKTFAAALSTHSAVFPERLQVIMKLGEASNSLPDAVKRTAHLLKQESAMRRELQSALVYPVILLAMSMLVMVMIVFYLAPTLEPVFASAGAEPPFLIAAMTGLRDLIIDNIGAASLGVAASFVVLYMSRRQIIASIAIPLRRLPIVSSYLNKKETLRFSLTVSLMMSAGARLPEALNAAAESAGSLLWRNQIEHARREVEAGGSLSDAFDGFERFDSMTLSLLRAGEESDEVVAMLSSAADQLQEATRNALQQVLRLLTPALTLCIGGMIGVLIISTISAILDLNDIAF